MNVNNESSTSSQSILRRLREHQRGQTFVMIAVALFGILGAAALVVDVGRVYYGYQQLLAQTRAAALAGGAVMSNDGETLAEVTATATSYSGALTENSSGTLTPVTPVANDTSNLLTNVIVTATPRCLTSAAATAEGVPSCKAYELGDNAVQVTETAKVPTTFANVLGFPSWSISATALASAKGGSNGPYNVAIIIDTTNSMTQPDKGNCNADRITCALEGVQTLLSTLSPCAAGLTTCPGTTTTSFEVPSPASGDENGTNVDSNPIDEVALFTFPGLAASGSSIGNVQDDTKCPTKTPPITSYNEFYNYTNCTGAGAPVPCCSGSGAAKCTGKGTPLAGCAGKDPSGTAVADNTACSSNPNPPVYEIVPFSSDYRTSDTATTLVAASELVIAAGKGCSTGLAAPGGEGTFYAGVIDTAQSALVAQQTTRKDAGVDSQNVMILVSDGEANADADQTTFTTTGAGSEGMQETKPAPSTVYLGTGQCAQAVARSQAAAAAGTTVYAVAYGAESTGCSTDSGTYASPVCTMQGIANSPTTPGSYSQNNNNFFTDVTSTTSSCASDARSTSTLDQIFQAIGLDLTTSRLIPNGTT
ncbi:MAG: TadG family pilus assembly protein [Candidatus Binatus sp.]|jgi:Flp pilus assembly protein TadG|uniref:TadG family pilus assembly protein n=1 Tax=Candidatus Binatus sp. TaxID=2811406 RepID=UPI003C7238F0